MKKVTEGLFSILLIMFMAIFTPNFVIANSYQTQIKKLQNWLTTNKDINTGLPHSYVDDKRFENWTITYDSAVVTLAYIATRRINDAKRILDFYIRTPDIWRLGGIIEAVDPTGPVLGRDWSVRAGANLWMGIAAFHLYEVTAETRYLELAEKIANLAVSLQNGDKDSINFGAVRLGPKGGKNVAGDQHLDYDITQPAFYDIFATEVNIDAYALFNMLHQETKKEDYRNARDKVLDWLKRVAYNKKEHRFNRGGYKGKPDTTVATDVHSWGISALGGDVLDTFEPGLAEKMIEFIEENCLAEVSYTKPNGKKIKVKGVDFIDYKRAAELGRDPLVSPEWTFQLINAYRRLEKDLAKRKEFEKAAKYEKRREALTKSILDLAIELNDSLAYPYATQADAEIGHEYRTPKEGNLSMIGTAYAVLALSGFDPLVENKIGIDTFLIK